MKMNMVAGTFTLQAANSWCMPHGARAVRKGNWQPKDWKFTHPTYEEAA